MTSEKQGGGPRVGLTRDRIFDTALALANQGGLEAVSMRRLAAELGVEAMSLYNHVANKDDVLAGLLDLVYAGVALPDQSTEWKAAMRQTAVSTHRAFLEHPWASRLLHNTASVGPAQTRSMEAILGCLRRGGFSADMTHRAYHAIDGYIVGFTLWQASFSMGPEELLDAAADFLGQLNEADYPHLAEHIRQHLEPSTEAGRDDFEFGLDLILDGLDRVREEPS